MSVHPGENTFTREVQLKDAHLWWTWDLGAQNLYQLTATISPAGGPAADTRATVFGVRTITRNSDMSYWLNGKRLFLKGAWYPMADYYGSKPTHETYVKDLEMYKAANLNHLVAFTVVEKPDFYDLCDRMGILDMLEFPFSQFGPMEVLAYSNPRREIFVKAIARARSARSSFSFATILPSSSGPPLPRPRSRDSGGETAMKTGASLATRSIPTRCKSWWRSLTPARSTTPACAMWANSTSGWPMPEWESAGATRSSSTPTPALFPSTAALPCRRYETLQKILTPDELWSDQPTTLPRWFNLPIDIPSYAYQTSFEYKGLYSVLHRVNQFVDRHIQSAQELVDDSQLYQAFMFKYSTESYRRKKYNSINGTRIWAYGEVTPGIRFNFLDYYRVPKMGYYYLKNAQARFAVNFAYEQALESQVSGTRLKIPVWVVNDYRRDVPFSLHCEILDLQGGKLWSQDADAVAGNDASKQVGVVEWTTPDQPGIYVLRARAAEKGGEHLTAENTAFIKVTPAPVFAAGQNAADRREANSLFPSRRWRARWGFRWTSSTMNPSLGLLSSRTPRKSGPNMMLSGWLPSIRSGS